MTKTVTLFAVIIVASCCLTACNRATEGDRIALARLERTWGEKYEFHLSSEVYWTAKLRPNATLDENELRRIFDDFSGTRKDTVFTYMNVYDPMGKFVFQLFRREDGRIATETKAEHY